MRCTIGLKKIVKYRKQTGLPVLAAFVRGGTDHRIDLCLDNGSVIHLYKDGKMKKASLGWDIESWKVCQSDNRCICTGTGLLRRNFEVKECPIHGY